MKIRLSELKKLVQEAIINYGAMKYSGRCQDCGSDISVDGSCPDCDETYVEKFQDDDFLDRDLDDQSRHWARHQC